MAKYYKAIDIMVRDRFFAQMRIETNPIFTLTEDDVKEQVEKRYPTLKNVKYTVCFGVRKPK